MKGKCIPRHHIPCNPERNEGYISKNATCGYLGEKILSCTKCGYKKTEMIASPDHNWITDKYSDSKYICSECCLRRN